MRCADCFKLQEKDGTPYSCWGADPVSAGRPERSSSTSTIRTTRRHPVLHAHEGGTRRVHVVEAKTLQHGRSPSLSGSITSSWVPGGLGETTPTATTGPSTPSSSSASHPYSCGGSGIAASRPGTAAARSLRRPGTARLRLVHHEEVRGQLQRRSVPSAYREWSLPGGQLGDGPVHPPALSYEACCRIPDALRPGRRPQRLHDVNHSVVYAGKGGLSTRPAATTARHRLGGRPATTTTTSCTAGDSSAWAVRSTDHRGPYRRATSASRRRTGPNREVGSRRVGVWSGVADHRLDGLQERAQREGPAKLARRGPARAAASLHGPP